VRSRSRSGFTLAAMVRLPIRPGANRFNHGLVRSGRLPHHPRPTTVESQGAWRVKPAGKTVVGTNGAVALPTSRTREALEINNSDHT